MNGIVAWSADITLALILLGVLFSVIRLLLGPSLPDRVVSLDLIAVMLIAIIAVLSIKNNDSMFMNVGLALGLISFLSTVAFARYIGRRRTVEKRDTIPLEKSFCDWGDQPNE
jgi:multicomponent Na+:H+ antiporter subunit F